MQNELASKGDNGADGRCVEWLANGTERPGKAIGDLLGISSQEDHGGAVVGDQTPGDLWPGQAVQQINVHERQRWSFTFGNDKGSSAIHRASNDITPEIIEHELKFHRQDGLVLDDHDPKVRQFLHHASPPPGSNNCTLSVTAHFKRALGELVRAVVLKAFDARSMPGGRMTADPEIRITEREARRIAGYDLLQALVGIRLRSVTDPESRRHLTWLSDIVAAMGLMTRRTLPGEDVDFAAYMDDAASFWRRACEEQAVRIDVRAAAATVPESHALPLAIILHELLSNAVRHAFTDAGRGSIAVAYSRANDGVSLVVRDSGIGAAVLTKGDGLLLVEGLVAHLGGAMTIETAPNAGVGVRVRLPLPDARPH